MGILAVAQKDGHCKMATIYGLQDPQDMSLFYVGVTIKPLNTRLSSHLNDAVHLQMRGGRYEAIRRVTDAGLRPVIFGIETVLLKDWEEAEQFWIAYFRSVGAHLTNISTGGRGASGAKNSAETIKNKSEAAKLRGTWMLRTPEVRERAAKATGHSTIVDGVEYRSIKDAAAQTGIPYSTLRHRLFPPPKRGMPRGEMHPNSKPVEIAGRKFASKLDAHRELGIAYKTINRRIAAGRARYL